MFVRSYHKKCPGLSWAFLYKKTNLFKMRAGDVIIPPMDSGFDTLSYTLGLSPYQAAVLRRAARRYDMSRIAVRDGVVYVPHATHTATDFLRNVFIGRRGDAVAKNKILARNISLKNVGVWR